MSNITKLNIESR